MKVYINREDIPKKPTEAGSETRNTYRWEYDENDPYKKKLVVDEVINQQEEINSYYDETKIENIVKRAAYDPKYAEAISPASMFTGEEVDISDMPNTLAEAQELMLHVKHVWQKLPASKKEIFDNDVDTFIRSYGTQKWVNALEIQPAAQEKQEEKTE